jgi:hypothetical protein
MLEKPEAVIEAVRAGKRGRKRGTERNGTYLSDK